MKTIDENSTQRFAAHMRAKGRQPATVDSYHRDCQTFMTFLLETGVKTGDIEPATLESFQDYLRNKGHGDNSVRRSVIGVRQFFRFLQDEQGWDISPFDAVAIPERHDCFTHRITPENVASLLQAIHSETSVLKSKRDGAMLHLLAHEGLKAAELIQVTWGDFLVTSEYGILRIRGPRSRTLHLEADTTLAIANLRNLLAELGQGTMIGPRSKIMLSFKGADARHAISGLSRHGVKFALYELGDRIGIQHLNSEDLRHFAMAHKVALGFSPEMLMNHLGLRTPGKMSRHFPDLPPHSE